MTAETEVPAHNNKSVLRRVMIASGLGTLIEYFDYASYSYLATVIAVVFFPAQERSVAIMMTFAVFALSFLVRPIGAFVWGLLGDRRGRKTILATTILIMSGATLLIGFLPSYNAIGIAAPILLLVLRMTQSFSAAGEYAGAGIFIAEYAPARNRAIFTSVVPMAAAGGFLLASAVTTSLYSLFTTEFMEQWGWRIPFFIAGPLGLLGLWLRARLEDTPQFRRMQALELETRKNTPKHANQWAEFLKSLPSFIKALMVMSLNAGAYYLLLSYTPTFLIEQGGMEPGKATLVVTIGLIAHIIMIPFIAKFSDRFGRKRILLVSSFAFIFVSYPVMVLFSLGNLWIAIFALIGSLVFFVMNDAVFPTYFSEMFGTKSRYLGFALAFNIGATFFGGVAPLIGTWLIMLTGNPNSPAFFLILIGFLSLVGVLLSKETVRTDLVDVQSEVGTLEVPRY